MAQLPTTSAGIALLPAFFIFNVHYRRSLLAGLPALALDWLHSILNLVIRVVLSIMVYHDTPSFEVLQ